MTKKSSEGAKSKAGWDPKAEVNGVLESLYIRKVPSYGNSFFYSLGFLLLTTFIVLVITGIVMVLFGPIWWDTNTLGIFIRSIHMWAAQAFAIFLILHLFTVFSTSAFRSNKKKLVWVLGALMFSIVIFQEVFGLGVRGDFLTQWNTLSAADFWNGLGLGYWINPLNWGAVFGWHAVIVPLLLVFIMSLHYSLVRKHGISKPYRNDIPYRMVETDHRKMYMRGIATVAIILVFAFFFRAPFVTTVTIHGTAQAYPDLIAATLVQEFNYSSGTATYFDTIDPYNFSTRQVYVTIPYSKYLAVNSGPNAESMFYGENNSMQKENIGAAYLYFSGNGTLNTTLNPSNPLVSMISALTTMAQSGLYGGVLTSEESSSLNETYRLRFLADTGIMRSTALQLGLRLSQYGMLKDNSGWWPPGEWWNLPYNILDNTLLKNDPNADLDGGVIAALFFLLLIAFPFIPFVNEIPDRLGLYKLFWNRFTIPDYDKLSRSARWRKKKEIRSKE